MNFRFLNVNDEIFQVNGRVIKSIDKLGTLNDLYLIVWWLRRGMRRRTSAPYKKKQKY